ncbi:MAG TPA: LapA family protein [Microthrixaceae bacterium]|nr:LapA family protein [Microthrixaceae bacterium]
MSLPNQPGSDFRETRSISKGWIIGAVAAVIALVLVLQNRTQVPVSFLFFDLHMRVWVLCLITLALGMTLGWFGPRLVRRARNRRAGRNGA